MTNAPVLAYEVMELSESSTENNSGSALHGWNRVMEPITLLALAAAAGFLFRRSKPSITTETKPQKPPIKIKVADRLDKPYKWIKKDLSELEILPEYKLAKSLIDAKFPLLFVTGSAGTGKSTFVEWICAQYEGKVLIGAPTGVAALNVGGKTLHSLCQLPPAWILKSDITKARRDLAIIKSAQVLIIDEISMVNANLLDGVSAFFRENRDENKPFGGIPVIMVGDLFQLPPIVSNNVKDLMIRNYSNPKFYNARSLNESVYYGIELTKTFRQTEQVFVDLLSAIREGRGVEEALKTINAACRITNQPLEGAVWLSPRNLEVDKINQTKLQELSDPGRIYNGHVEGDFKENRVPSPIKLHLKTHAQVMFTKNDRDKRWVNGTVGQVVSVHDNYLKVKIHQTKEVVNVTYDSWEEFAYAWDHETKSIGRVVTGKYIQIPLTLAWAMTIHKSQGKTIEQVHIDLGRGAFQTGQTYVALSRCRTLDGLSLSRPLEEEDIIVDIEAREFYDSLREKVTKLPPEKLLEELNINH